jgi:hypothetical protein
MYVKVAVGDKLYIWKPSASVNNTKAVISAHGGQSIINSTFEVPRALRLVFYGPHGHSLLDPGLKRLITGEIRPFETQIGGICPDYSLGKYQGRTHGSVGEAYGDIRIMDQGYKVEKGTVKGIGEDKKEVEIEVDRLKSVNLPLGYDIITIRNRRMRSDPMLSEVISDLAEGARVYQELHCAFCRGPSLCWKSALGDHDTSKNLPGL